MTTPAHIVPEWYFLPFYAILRAINFNILFLDSKLLGVIAMVASIAILFFLPKLDKSKVRSARFRPIYKVRFWVFMPTSFPWMVGSKTSRSALHAVVTNCDSALLWLLLRFALGCQN